MSQPVHSGSISSTSRLLVNLVNSEGTTKFAARHGYRAAVRHAYRPSPTGCQNVSGVYMDMSVGTCTDRCTDMCTGLRADKRTDECLDMSIDVYR